MKRITHRIVGFALVFAAGFAVTGCDAISGYLAANRAASNWDGPIQEIAYESLEKDGKVFTIEMHSQLDAPPDVVWKQFKQAERLAEFSDQYKLSKLLKEEGNVKELEIHVLALDNLQAFTVRMEYDDAAKKATVKTLASAMMEIDGSYELQPSPDGTKTLYIYKAIQTDKVALPISTDVQRSAIKESFVNQIRAIKGQLGAG